MSARILEGIGEPTLPARLLPRFGNDGVSVGLEARSARAQGEAGGPEAQVWGLGEVAVQGGW